MFLQVFRDGLTLSLILESEVNVQNNFTPQRIFFLAGLQHLQMNLEKVLILSW